MNMNPFWLLMSYECPLTTKFLYCGDTQIKNTKILYYNGVVRRSCVAVQCELDKIWTNSQITLERLLHFCWGFQYFQCFFQCFFSVFLYFHLWLSANIVVQAQGRFTCEGDKIGHFSIVFRSSIELFWGFDRSAIIHFREHNINIGVA